MSNKRVPVGDKMKADEKRRKSAVDALFTPTTETTTEPSVSESEIVPASTQESKENDATNEEEVLIRRTYYMTKELIDALYLYSKQTKVDMSSVVREALTEHIPEQIFDMASLLNEMDFE